MLLHDVKQLNVQYEQETLICTRINDSSDEAWTLHNSPIRIRLPGQIAKRERLEQVNMF
jgi:hypothetical protein